MFAPPRMLLLCVFGSLLIWFVPRPLRAEASEAEASAAQGTELALYERLIAEAVREYRLTHFAEARALFVRAQELFPNARALRGLGMVEFELRNYADCIGYLRRALDSTVKPLEGSLLAETELLLQRAERYVARLEIHATPRPTRVLVDGAPVKLGTNDELMLGVGDHALELQASGYEPVRRNYKVHGGERELLRVSFSPYEPPLSQLELAFEPEEPEPSARRDGADSSQRGAEPPLYKRTWLWSAVGVAVAAVAVGLGFGLTNRPEGTQEPVARWPIATRRGP